MRLFAALVLALAVTLASLSAIVVLVPGPTDSKLYWTGLLFPAVLIAAIVFAYRTEKVWDVYFWLGSVLIASISILVLV